MNPWDLSASDLLIWGLVAHLIADWPLQNDWMANNKMRRRPAFRVYDGGGSAEGEDGALWFDRHPAAYVHSGIHGVLLSLVFGPMAGFVLALVHLVIDCRWPVAKWSRLVRQTQPQGVTVLKQEQTPQGSGAWHVPVVDIGTEVRFWTDQVFHIACVAVAALLVTL